MGSYRPPRTGISSDRLKFLATPKLDYEPMNIYNHQEFRGLLHADFEEAIANCNSIKNRTARLPFN